MDVGLKTVSLVLNITLVVEHSGPDLITLFSIKSTLETITSQLLLPGRDQSREAGMLCCKPLPSTGQLTKSMCLTVPKQWLSLKVINRASKQPGELVLQGNGVA